MSVPTLRLASSQSHRLPALRPSSTRSSASPHSTCGGGAGDADRHADAAAHALHVMLTEQQGHALSRHGHMCLLYSAM